MTKQTQTEDSSVKIKQIAKDAGISQRKLAEKFEIPYRTVENWSEGKRKCPSYILKMMEKIIKLEK